MSEFTGLLIAVAAIVLGILAKELYLEWKDSQDLFRAIDEREALTNLMITAAACVVVSCLASAAAERIKNPPRRRAIVRRRVR